MIPTHRVSPSKAESIRIEPRGQWKPELKQRLGVCFFGSFQWAYLNTQTPSPPRPLLPALPAQLNKGNRPPRYDTGPAVSGEPIEGLGLTLAAELRQAQNSYDGPQQDHGARFRRVDKKLLHGAEIGIIAYWHDDVPAGGKVPTSNRSLRCMQIVVNIGSVTGIVDRADQTAIRVGERTADMRVIDE